VLRRNTLPPEISWRGARPNQAQNAVSLGHFWRATASAVGQTVGGPGPVTYQLLGAGTFALENATPPTTNIDLGFEAVQNTLNTPITHFGGNLSGNFFARLDFNTLNGSWRVQCPGPTHFTNTGTLTFQACPDAQF
jgi:hypothetical protein